MSTQDMLEAARRLEDAADRLAGSRFTIGFDGFVDDILQAVATRRDKDAFERIRTIPEFSARIAAAAGKSANIELVSLQTKPGGNGPIMSMAVSGMGGAVTCIGLLGRPHLHPVFRPLGDKATLISVGNPGRTDAVEFQDGKIMLGHLETIADMRWDVLEEVVGAERLRTLLLEADLTACTNWTMLTEMDGVLERVIELAAAGPSRARFFFDLADPEKRDRRDLERVLDQIRRLNRHARCVLGLNLSEAEQVGAVLGHRDPVEETAVHMEASAWRIAEALNLHAVVVHAVQCAGAVVDGESAGIDGPWCANPRLSTGAGDHFNGGFVSALVAGLDVRSALYAGVGTSGWYVRNARSPGREDVVGLLRDWATGKLAD